MSNLVPEDLLYTKEHEWILRDGNQVKVGITDFAQSSLGDIVFMELPEVGSAVGKDSSFGVVESIKSVSDLYAPISGEVMAVNADLVDSPEQCNLDAYSSWMIEVKISNESELDQLLSAQEYKEHCDNQ